MTIIPNPLSISCTTCHQAMRVEHQSGSQGMDGVLVAAECRCGRSIGMIWGESISTHTNSGRPLIAHDIVADPELGDWARKRIASARERIAESERWIAAATWAHEKPRKEPVP
jgi:hypothetical protein